MRALERLPREKTLDGIRAYNSMKYVFNFCVTCSNIALTM